ncbi:class I SAM-dependent methyltransferase [uncultured Lentibacter sp.]|uniref:class I SAM-dependent methyltransferase n=1 Tax=uncultured Lentibacter sp. TaxID=1659309 RepID=UPI00261C1214|nr:class I SAM-dependent methyltransferase [uncultured Lentibacter sp.]
MVDSKKFWDRMAPKYAESPMRSVKDYEHTLAITKSYLAPDMRVLELGCGTGTTALSLAPLVGQYIGTDQSGEMIRIAREKAEEAGLSNLSFLALSAQESTQRDERFDVVMGFNLFHLTPDPEGLMRDIFALLAPGGLMISKTPCLADRAFGWKRFLVRAILPLLKRIGKAPQVGLWRIADVDRLIDGAGFETVEAGNWPAISRYVVARKLE